MTSNTPSDDYVAEILKRDASRTNSNRYLTSGLGSLLSSSRGNGRPRSNAPKPNTRFLRTIVREADSHNAALRTREEESRVRLRRLRDNAPSGHALDRSRRVTDRSHSDEKRSSRHDPRSTERTSKRRVSRSAERREKRPRKRRERSRSQERERRRDEQRHPGAEEEKAEQEEPEGQGASDSDPLDSFLGPMAPPKSLPRGRGALKNSGMDARFNDATYDPKTDVDLSEADGLDDWDMALEALRDRVKCQKSRTERLQAAGFTEEEVSRLEDRGRERDETDVKWRKKGEQREWDRGKVLDDDGTVDVRPEWGRLKGT